MAERENFMKKIIFTLALILVFLLSGISVSAADNRYYMVEGRIYADGSGEITRSGIVEKSGAVRSGTGREYALLALNAGDILYSVALDVSFRSSSDVNAPPSEYAEFIGMIPYDIRIHNFELVDSDFAEICWHSIYEPYQTGIVYFDVEKTDGGFSMEWGVVITDISYADLLTFDIIAVSQKTGEKNILAYRTTDTYLEIPYAWLDPNDTFTFMLESNDTVTTLFAESAAFNTPGGESKTITEEWSEIGANEWEDVWIDWEYLLEILPFILIPVAGVIILVIVIMIMRKKKSKDGKSEKPKKEKAVKEKTEKKIKIVETVKPTAVIADITLKINGAAVETKYPPMSENGRIFVPVRIIAEALGYIAAWNSETQILDVYNRATKELLLSMKTGSEKVKVSTGIQGVMDERMLDVPARLIYGVIYVQASFIAETLGCIFDWDEAAITVNITKLTG